MEYLFPVITSHISIEALQVPKVPDDGVNWRPKGKHTIAERFVHLSKKKSALTHS